MGDLIRFPKQHAIDTLRKQAAIYIYLCVKREIHRVGVERNMTCAADWWVPRTALAHPTLWHMTSQAMIKAEQRGALPTAIRQSRQAGYDLRDVVLHDWARIVRTWDTREVDRAIYPCIAMYAQQRIIPADVESAALTARVANRGEEDHRTPQHRLPVTLQRQPTKKEVRWFMALLEKEAS
jgi:hypothetical protein